MSLVSGTQILVKIAMMRQTTEWPKKGGGQAKLLGVKSYKTQTDLASFNHNFSFSVILLVHVFWEGKGAGFPFPHSHQIPFFQSIVAALQR